MNSWPWFDRPSHPVMFWVWNAGATLLLAALWLLVAMPLTDGHPLLRFMAAGALLVVAAYCYAPTCLDMTGWTMAVYAMLPVGLVLLVGSPLVYALFVAFVGPHVEVRIK